MCVCVCVCVCVCGACVCVWCVWCVHVCVSSTGRSSTLLSVLEANDLLQLTLQVTVQVYTLYN